MFIKLFNYEFWPYYIFYLPMFLWGVVLVLKRRTVLYFSPANPAMKFGGLLELPKTKINRLIPAVNLPKSILLEKDALLVEVLAKMTINDLNFPVIAKPNIGERGKKVEKIEDEEQLKIYLSTSDEDIIIQEYIDYDLELGILYFKYPGTDSGHIHSLTQKKFMTITGNGKDTLEKLISKEVRVAHRLSYFKEKFDSKMQEILVKGEQVLIEPIGNHNRGTIFLNANHKITNKLIRVFDEITKNMKGFYYGRFDVRAKSWDDLYQGINFRILELNGVSSEPAHVYDPNYRLINAYKDIFFHINVIDKIAHQNHKLGIPYDKFSDFRRDYSAHQQRNKKRKETLSG